jgi:hypothetical protein
VTSAALRGSELLGQWRGREAKRVPGPFGCELPVMQNCDGVPAGSGVGIVPAYSPTLLAMFGTWLPTLKTLSREEMEKRMAELS